MTTNTATVSAPASTRAHSPGSNIDSRLLPREERAELAPDKILQLGLGFWGAKTMLSAVELGVFTELAKGPIDGESLRARLGLHQRSARDFFDALVALGMLQRHDGRYRNTPESDLFLDRAKLSYIGGLLEMANARLFKHWANLTPALKSGEPQGEATGADDAFAVLYSDPARLKQFLSAMTGISMAAARALAQSFPWESFKSFLDVGGAQGCMSVQLALAHPHLNGGEFDLPAVGPIFDEYVQSFGLSQRLRFHPGSFFENPLPNADIIIMGHTILHDWDLEQKRMLIRKAHEALPKGGALIIYEAIIDDDRRRNAFGLLMSLNMLIETKGGFDFTGADCRGWMNDAGFKETRVEPLRPRFDGDRPQVTSDKNTATSTAAATCAPVRTAFPACVHPRLAGSVTAMTLHLSRRRFLSRTATASAFTVLAPSLTSHSEPGPSASDSRTVDFHVHLDNSTIEKVVELSKERGFKFGIVEHAGTKENQYPKVLSNDLELRGYLAMLEGKPVFKGIQAEWTDWMKCFAPDVLAQLDYVLTDAMTFPGKTGERIKLWTPEAAQQTDMSDKQAFMDRFVDWHVEVMAREPFDILANTTWLPAGMLEDWELYWTPPRMKKVIDAALKYGIALEISSSYKLPKLPFLKLAKAAGAKFSFGSNGRYPNMGKLDYSLEMAKQLDLKPLDMFVPAPDGQKAVQRRKF